MLSKLVLPNFLRGAVLLLCLSAFAFTLPPQTILDRELSVQSDALRHWSFEAEECSTVYGSFAAKGGKTNDIRVLIINRSDVLKHFNGESVVFYYDSGRKTQGEFVVTLEKGVYALVYDNQRQEAERTVTTKVQGEVGCRQ